MRALIDMAAARGAYVDQSQSLNLFQESPTIGKLSSMYMYAWEKGLKTTYYLRSRPATSINKVTISGSEGMQKASSPASAVEAAPMKVDDAAAIACSLENPEACESCQ
jgi:ribonucleoside-diphosphate reductase alpha chain